MNLTESGQRITGNYGDAVSEKVKKNTRSGTDDEVRDTVENMSSVFGAANDATWRTDGL